MNKPTGKHFKISACMMVRNEEKNLERCLESIQDKVDEIIIVDTGSTDKTLEIAKKYTQKIYQHEWEYNFSVHRNQSIKYATGAWILIIDADEELIVKDNKKFREYLWAAHNHGQDSIALVVDDVQKQKVTMSFNSARLFYKNTVHYEGIVHNNPIIPGKGSALCELATINHYGYDLTPEQKTAKTERTASLLQTRLEKNPDDYICYFYLSQLYATNFNHEKCVEYGEKYISFKDKLDKGFNGGIKTFIQFILK